MRREAWAAVVVAVGMAAAVGGLYSWRGFGNDAPGSSPAVSAAGACGLPEGVELISATTSYVGRVVSMGLTRIDQPVPFKVGLADPAADAGTAADGVMEFATWQEQLRDVAAGDCVIVTLGERAASNPQVAKVEGWREETLDACTHSVPRFGAQQRFARDGIVTGVIEEIDRDAFVEPRPGEPRVSASEYHWHRLDLREGTVTWDGDIPVDGYGRSYVFVRPAIGDKTVAGDCIVAVGREAFVPCGGGCDAAGFVADAVLVRRSLPGE